MIPIECPKCGRGGNVPPDRLNARLVCKACQSVFHMDTSGKITLGEPGKPDRKANRHAEAARAVKQPVDFNLSETLAKIPKPVLLAIPLVIGAALLWAKFKPGPGEPDYVQRTANLVKAVVKDDKAAVLAFASESTGDAAGKWFDLLHKVLVKKNFGPESRPIASLFDGEPDKESTIHMSVIVANAATDEQFPYMINVYLAKSGSGWVFDGAKSFDDAAKVLAKVKP